MIRIYKERTNEIIVIDGVTQNIIGNIVVTTIGERVSISQDGKYLGYKIPYQEYVNKDGNPFGSLQELIDYLNDEFGSKSKYDKDRIARQEKISYLQKGAKGTPIEPHVKELLKRYKDEVLLYIQGETEDFEQAVANESNSTYVTYLETPVALPNVEYPNGKRVRDSINEQIKKNGNN